MKLSAISSIALVIAVVSTAVIAALESLCGADKVFITALILLPILFVWSVFATKKH
jgi:hypothetical protein